MTPREKIETLRRNLNRGEFPWSNEVRALLDVAEAAARHIEEKFSDPEAVKCDLGPEECSACNLEQALVRLGKEP